jgi:hypothetical protein
MAPICITFNESFFSGVGMRTSALFLRARQCFCDIVVVRFLETSSE